MDQIMLDDFTESCVIAAIKGYTSNGKTPQEASKNAIELVRHLAKELNYNGDVISIDSLNKLQQLENKIGRKFENNDAYNINKAFDSGMSIEDVLKKNPHFLNKQS